MAGIHYAVVVEGTVIGARTSAGHKAQVYTHAVVGRRLAEEPLGVWSYHGSAALAAKARSGYSTPNLEIVPVVTTARRAKIGEVL